VTTPDKAQAEADKQVAKWRSTLDDPAVRAAAAKWVADAKADLASAQAQAAGANVVNHEQLDATVVYMQDVLNVAQQWQASTQSASDGQVLFMANTGCARCHTRGWSWFDPTNPEGNPPPGIMGGGAFGSNLTGGDVNAQFPPPTGETDLFGWISVGVDQYQQYGIRGISSGRMAHFGAVLTKDQIEAIMAYERSL
jgi:mono/diheme cytochrome c family protein